MGAGDDSAARRWLAVSPRVPAASAASQHDVHSVLGDLPALALNLSALRRTFNQDRIRIVDVHVDASPGNALEYGKGTILPANGHMPHAAASLGTGSARDHLVVAKERAVEKHDIGALDPLHHRGSHCGGARTIDEARVPVPTLDAAICRRLAPALRILAFEIERQLARHHEHARLDLA